ncbi:RNA 2',3'-cyclic phosphodiesterase [Chryseobacterium indologenes]|uniref:2'-5' RNA ligase family protein n=1 Tax=Chryseobacterium indologenes TaxID=253 RepID=UPI000BFE5E84|nr:2'-5' RNA ligase family protein [Chryseobacterium indologenes]ATN06842.1 RNA 2',3'-cyclic phosphodiesterase [Chryseobacterium indologenes]AYY84412.1 2'-5' RNA ligase family protein [Chryseobacterium indologenes]QIX81366.1 2'-5' RNA ligase family protein [Chryseobacterium indologenes]TLX25670.1 2'-5' RNA ligase family protein [Chryseobacterium indologenes]UDQ55117.1 2'-5' RNA ligase family protein [Chryseobacterium indologenes]
MKKLYFIAIYPPTEIIEEVRIFKKDLAIYYDNSKALKNEAHITLFPPFSREIEWEDDIFTAFQKIDTHMNPFKIELNGFGSFANPKNPVIYIHPEISSELQDLYKRVKQQFSFAPYSFNPHMTVGYRDLTWENYLRAWEKYQHFPYKTNFLVDKILLLRHDGNWVPIAEKRLETN